MRRMIQLPETPFLCVGMRSEVTLVLKQGHLTISCDKGDVCTQEAEKQACMV